MIYPRYKSKKLTDSSRGKDCTLRIPGVCNFNPETTVAAHVNVKRNAAMGGKASDFHIVDACCNCHTWMDSEGRNSERWFEYVLDAMIETQMRLHSEGLLNPR